MSLSKFQCIHSRLVRISFSPILIIKCPAFFVHIRFFSGCCFLFLAHSLKCLMAVLLFIVKKHVSCLVLLHTTQLFEHFILVSFSLYISIRLFSRTYKHYPPLALCMSLSVYTAGVSILVFFKSSSELIKPF